MVKKKKTALSLLKKKFPSKKILKAKEVSLIIQHKEVPKVLSDPNRFFKDEMEEVKKTMFLK